MVTMGLNWRYRYLGPLLEPRRTWFKDQGVAAAGTQLLKDQLLKLHFMNVKEE